MTITFGLTAEDLFLFNQYLFDNSRPIQKAFTKNRTLIAYSPILVALLISFLNHLSLNHLAMLVGTVAVTISLPAYFMYPMYVRKNLRKRIFKMYSAGQNRGVIGEHELLIDSEGLVEKTPLGEVRQEWGIIDRIVLQDDRTYIFISDTQAYILPRNSIVSGDYDAFVAELQRLRGQQG